MYYFNVLFVVSETTSLVTKHILVELREKESRYRNIVWTYNMRQNAVLIKKAQEFNEPVLLVGDTGGGKTTICKILAEMNNQELVTVNCHMHTESGDFIGGLHPVRDHSVRIFYSFKPLLSPNLHFVRCQVNQCLR